ncbi:hypothetical protein C0Z18_12265 [Trinickia dabaoshanensis]|uniref:Phage virion morphogenesis protein n=1 Tax=Trinickia dabaoshanensis TaxID=564714 RepID=A0A2N7VSU1_9BURK|nr:phage virion morphogenesis protein [Trinickia dabaoshanensis]PMS20195.1 hypothetical protein C0Z18_12265 [Trinickia dabaoshanensis]
MNKDPLAVGFGGRMARLARVHQFGEKATINPGGPEYRYPARVLLGLTDVERVMVRDHLLGNVTI